MDDGCGNGLSGWAWHELGRQAEADHQTQMRAAAAFAARLRGEVRVDVGALIAENQALRRQNQALLQQNQQLEASVRIWAEDYQLLKDWGEAIHTRLRQLRGDLPS